jgi:hypothetical protein
MTSDTLKGALHFDSKLVPETWALVVVVFNGLCKLIFGARQNKDLHFALILAKTSSAGEATILPSS